MKTEKFTIFQYIKNYKFNSIFIKNFFLNMIPVSIAIIIITTAVYHFTFTSINEEVQNTNISSLSKIKSVCDMLFSESNQISSNIASDSDISMLMAYDEIQPIQLYDNFKTLYKSMNLVTFSNSLINSIYVYFEKSRFIFATDGYSAPLTDFFDQGCIEDYESLKDKYTYWAQARVFSTLTKSNFKFISVFRAISNSRYSGAIIVNFDILKIKDVIDNADGDKNTHKVIIVNDDGTILYHSDLALITKNMKDIKDYQNIRYEEANTVIRKFPSGDQIISVLRSDYNNISYISITPVSNYSQKTNSFLQFIAFIVACSIIISTVIAFFTSIRIYQPVKNVLSLFRKNADWEDAMDPAESKPFNEFTYITTNIINSFNKNKEMKIDLENRLTLLRKSQAIALQSQINPHFLYNTLETINWKAMGLTGGENEVSMMIGNLSKLLRLSLETQNDIVTLGMEIEHVKYYLDIQKIRYKNKFSVKWDIGTETLNCKLVKLSLQPLVENAVYHGIKPKEGAGIIRISSRKTVGHCIEIVVFDDGVGISEEKVQYLNEQMKSGYIKENVHIGISNVNQRVKLLFGDDYGIRIESRLGQYTSIILKIPESQ